jgi:hypothetical protein
MLRARVARGLVGRLVADRLETPRFRAVAQLAISLAVMVSGGFMPRS